VRRFAELRTHDENIKTGDIAVVEGDATVAGVGIVGGYRYERGELPEAPSHTYWRDINYMYKDPVKIRDLPDRFQQGGKHSVHLPETIQQYDIEDIGVIGELLSALTTK
jgi:hypothetical protein